MARYSKWAITQVASPPEYGFGVPNIREPESDGWWGRMLTINYSSVVKVYFGMPTHEMDRCVLV